MHERFPADRFDGSLDFLWSPWRINTGADPNMRMAVPFGCAGYAYTSEKLRARRGAPKYLRAEPIVCLGYKHMYSNVYKCLTRHGSTIEVEKVEWDMSAPLGVFPDVRRVDLPEGEDAELLDLFVSGKPAADPEVGSDARTSSLRRNRKNRID